MKNAYSFKCAEFFSLFGIAIFTVATLLCMVRTVLSFDCGQANFAVYLVLTIGFFILDLLSILVLNRYAYIVTYECDLGIICRKGFICGYMYQVKVEDIRDIIILSVPKETTFYVFLDSNNTRLEGGYKNSFIKLEKNERNYNFIKQFWNKPIKEYDNYAEAYRLSKME